MEHSGTERDAGGGPVACQQTWDTRLRGPLTQRGRGAGPTAEAGWAGTGRGVPQAALGGGKGCNLGRSPTTEARGDEGTESTPG